MTLDELRQRLDAVDVEIVRRVGERLTLIDQVIEAKRREGRPLYDPSRERGVFDRVRAAARAAGVPEGVAEDAFRVLLAESHRRQARAHAALSAAEPGARRTVAIVGGTGAMGRFLGRVLESLGHEVLAASESTALTPAEAAARADLTVVSVPIGVTVDVIRAVGPHVRPGCGLADLTSLKAGPVRAMLEATERSGADVVGAHPLFGPGVPDLNRQVVVLCPGRGERWAAWLRAALEGQGAVVRVTTPEEHDRLMAVIQVLKHMETIAFGRCLAALGVDTRRTLEYTSPVYRLELALVGRIFSQSPDLYAEIAMGNPESPAMADAFERTVRELADEVRRGDRERFVARFAEVARALGGFKGEATAESDYLIRKLVERA